MRIAVIFPSRGLAFSETCEELLDNLQGLNYDIFFAHGLDIPECFNKPLIQALRGAYTHFWFVEDDMILPKNTLSTLYAEMKAEKVQAICCDYPVTKHGTASTFRDPDNNAIYGGTGCLLVTREFIKSFKKPVFRTDIAWDVKIGDRFEATPRKIKGDLYGLHDVNFALLAYGRNTPIKVSSLRCGQRKLVALGQAGTNNGEHWIELWTKLTPDVLKMPKLTHRNVILKDGTRVLMGIERAKELQEQGKLTIPSEHYVELVDNEVLRELL